MNTLLKRFLVILTVLALVFSLAACGPSEDPVEEPEEQEEPAEEPEEEPEESNEVEEEALSYFANYESSNIIPSEDVFAMMDNEEDIFILDIRQPDVYAEGHIEGAVNIPWNRDFGYYVENLPKDKPIYLYCYTGQTAGQATAVLRMAGYDVQSIKYGFVLGISNTEGYEDYLETDVNELASDAVSEMSSAMEDRVIEYFEDMASADIKNNIISSEAAYSLLRAEDDSIHFLSIRQAADYEEAHIPTATNIPWGKDMQIEFDSLPKDKTIIVNCYSGQTAGQAVAVMRFLGYDAVSLKSGLGTGVTAPSGWVNEGFPTHTIEEAATDYFANYESSNIIPSEDVFAMIDSEEDMVVLDIRQPDVYAEGHIQGAVNIPWNAEFGQHVESLPMDKPIYLYCYTGQTAGQATAVLRMAGYDVQSIKYGFVLGVSNTEGHEAYLETEANELPAEAVSEMAPAMKARVVKYFEEMASADIKNNIISSEAANALLEAGDESVYFLSIRQAEDYAKGHIPTAANIPWGKDMHLEFNTLPTDKTVIVNCYSGQTAGQAVAVMRFLGYDAVSLKSGMGTDVTAPSGWSNEGFEVVQ